MLKVFSEKELTTDDWKRRVVYVIQTFYFRMNYVKGCSRHCKVQEMLARVLGSLLLAFLLIGEN